jgi:hypothetical protein
VSLKARAMVTAGFANEVDAVNQYAATMYAATANGVSAARVRPTAITTPTRPNVAIPSLAILPEGAASRAILEHLGLPTEPPPPGAVGPPEPVRDDALA